MASLRVLKGEDAGRVFDLPSSGEVKLGRKPDNEVQVQDTRVSSLHLVLECTGGVWFVTDLGSRNGTFVNREKIDQKKALFAGDRILVGKTLMELVEDED